MFETMQSMFDLQYSTFACIHVLHGPRDRDDCCPKLMRRQIHAFRQGGLALSAPYDDSGLSRGVKDSRAVGEG
jgi:hypothetical protein